jgi:hypothetical protein
LIDEGKFSRDIVVQKFIFADIMEVSDPLNDGDDSEGDQNEIDEESEGEIIADQLDGTNKHQSNRKKRLLKKAPSAPKRFKSAYICFVVRLLRNLQYFNRSQLGFAADCS